MPFAVENDELTNPIPVGVLCPQRIMLESHDLAKLFAAAQFLGWGRAARALGAVFVLAGIIRNAQVTTCEYGTKVTF
jgi:hypothetical protein